MLSSTGTSLVAHTPRSCAVCGSNSKKVLFRQQFSTVMLVRGYSAVVCEDCGFAFADEIPEQRDFDAYYRDLSKYEYEHRDGKESTKDEERFVEITDLLAKAIPSPNARILDIGCSTGRMLAMLRDRGFPNVWGLDPSPGCATAARKLYDVTVLTNTLSGLAELNEKFDFLIMIGVLEHVRDLDAALATVHQILNPNGRIHIDVPDATQFADWEDAPFQEFSIEHINFFSGRSLANLMQTHGFRFVSSQKAQRNYSETTVIPSVEGIFEKCSTSSSEWTRDEESEPRLMEYIRQSQAEDHRIRALIDSTSAAGRPIIVWGVGTHTQRLLAIGALEKANISVFVDSNPKYHGQKLRGIPIVPPTDLKQRKEPVLICSRVFQPEIQRQIRNDLKLDNELVLLYELGHESEAR